MAERAGASLHSHGLSSLEASLGFFMVISGFTVAWEGKPQCTTNFWASACVVFAHVSLLKTSHMAKPMWKRDPIFWFKNLKNTVTIFLRLECLKIILVYPPLWLINLWVWRSRLARIYPHNFEPLFFGFCCLLVTKNSDTIPDTDPLYILITTFISSSSLETFRFSVHP